MKSPGFAKRFSLAKILIALLSFVFIMIAGSCSNQEQSQQTRELPGEQKITNTIQAHLNSASEISSEDISVSTEDGIVTLSGSIDNILAKRKATTLAESTFGVLSVVNNLKITASRPDEAIDKDVDQALATDPATETWDITTEVNNGMVTLTGRADSWQEKALAETIASRVKGVKHIKNNILVNPTASRSDKEIKTEVKETIKMNSRIGGNMVDVEVDDGNVSLKGAVGSAYEKNLAKDLAHVSGVESVSVDRLEVHPEYESSMFKNKSIDTLTGDQIKRAVTKALLYDPRVPEDSISVTLSDDVVSLAGTVENLNSKLAAAEDARNTAGINTVENNINVKHKVMVKPKVPTTDKAITKRIRYAMMRDPYVDEAAVDVEVKGGVANLKGKVDSKFKKTQIEDITSNVKGIVAIDNEIKITDQSQSANI